MPERDNVIVVGAGPVGFLTALGLARRGIEVTVLDSEPAVNQSPRAAVYFQTTLVILEKLGLLEDAEAIGLASSLFDMRYLATRDVVHTDMRDMAETDPRFDHVLHFGQHILADLVMRHLERLPNARVLWSHKVVGLAQDDAHVTLTVEAPEGAKEMRANWVVGSDGARSSVRGLAGLPFEGHTWPDRFVATNIDYDFFCHGFAPANMVIDPVNWAVIARLGRENLWRLTYGEDASLDEATILDRLPERFAQILPDASQPYRIVNFSPYRVHERCAPSFRVGRVVLAGDAAHACNPCGGLGLTTGIIDADALITVLSAVIEGRVGEGVLDFYAEERRRIFVEIVSPMASNFKRQMSEADPVRAAADKAAFIAGAKQKGPVGRASTMSALIFGRPMPV